MRLGEYIGRYEGLFAAILVLVLVLAWPGTSAAAERNDRQDTGRSVGTQLGDPGSKAVAGPGRKGRAPATDLEERRRRFLATTSLVLDLLDDAVGEGEEAASPWKPGRPPGQPNGRPPDSPPGKGGEPPGKPDDRPPPD